MNCNLRKLEDKFIKMIDKVSTFDEFDNVLKPMNNEDKGNLFELFYKLYFTLIPVYKNKFKKIYLYKEIPIEISKKIGLPAKDKGIDGLVITTDDKYYAVQVKFRENKKTIAFGSLSTFPALAFGSYCHHLNGGILFTNCYDVCDELKCNKYLNVTYSCFNKCDMDFWNSVRVYITNHKKISYKLMKPLSYQKPIIDAIEEYYKSNDYGILYLPCGTGKTFLGYWISTHILKCKKIFIIVPSLYLLSDTYETWAKQLYGSDFKYLLIGSEMDFKDDMDIEYEITTNINDIEKQLKYNKKILVISTYRSSELLKNACKKLKYEFDIGIFDEAHRTTGTDDKNYSSILKYKNISHKRLFMTATEKTFKYDITGEDTNHNNHIFSMDDENNYGKIIYNYSLRQAIENDQLVDYKIIAPFVVSQNFGKMIENNNIVQIGNLQCDMEILDLATMIIKSIKDFSIKHLLIFANKNKKAKQIMDVIEKLLDDDGVTHCKYLNGNDSMNKRKYEVSLFEKSKIGIISSSRIFGEGVNIPICDAVCFADNKCSTIDIIQYVGRCLRKCNSIPNKISHVLIPFVLDRTPENFFDSDNPSFYKLRKILKSLGTTDNLVSENFIIKNYSKHSLETNNDETTTQIINVGTNIDLNQFIKSVTTKLFDRNGDIESVIRNKIIKENIKRYMNDDELIDTKNKCSEYLKSENETIILETPNWIKYCLGNKLFEIMKRKYYYDKDEFKNACDKIHITNFETYKKYYKLDKKLPTAEYLNDGFYYDMDNKFNVDVLLDKNEKDCTEF